MFVNPYERLFAPKVENVEIVEGSFACQERGCFEVAMTAKYLPKEEILTWICNNKHISSIEGWNNG